MFVQQTAAKDLSLSSRSSFQSFTPTFRLRVSTHPCFPHPGFSIFSCLSCLSQLPWEFLTYSCVRYFKPHHQSITFIITFFINHITIVSNGYVFFKRKRNDVSRPYISSRKMLFLGAGDCVSGWSGHALFKASRTYQAWCRRHDAGDHLLNWIIVYQLLFLWLTQMILNRGAGQTFRWALKWL